MQSPLSQPPRPGGAAPATVSQPMRGLLDHPALDYSAMRGNIFLPGSACTSLLMTDGDHPGDWTSHTSSLVAVAACSLHAVSFDHC